MSLGFQVTFDCADPNKQADFWSKVLGYELQGPPPGFASWEDWLKANNVPEDNWNSASIIRDPEGKHPGLFFQKVPEGKANKNRVHLDVHLGLPQDSKLEDRQKAVALKVKEVEELGATKLGEHAEFGSFWAVLQDPEGNEFCIG